METEQAKFIMLFVTSTLTLIVILFKEYFKEKGKNLATREDIELITSKIENIKLEIANSHFQKNDLLEKRKITLIDFYENYILFSENYIRNISFIDAFIFQPQKIRERTDEIILQKGILEKSLWKLNIFEADDEKFIEATKEIYLKQLDYYHLTIDFLWEIENNSLLISASRISASSLTEKLAQDRKKLKNEFILKRDEVEKTTLRLTNKLMKIVREKYIELVK